MEVLTTQPTVDVATAAKAIGISPRSIGTINIGVESSYRLEDGILEHGICVDGSAAGDLMDAEGADAALAACEAVIERGLKSFVEVGQALARIRDERLYKAEFATFEDYCRTRWGFNSSRARQLIGAAQTVTNVTPLGCPPPATESQARELLGLEPGEAQEVMQAAYEATNGKITAKAIRQAREEYEAEGEPQYPVQPEDSNEPDLDVPEDQRSDEEKMVAHLHSNERKIREMLREFLHVPHFDFTEHNYERTLTLLTDIQQQAARIEAIYREQRNADLIIQLREKGKENTRKCE